MSGHQISRRTLTLPPFLWKEHISSGLVSGSTCGLHLVPLTIYGQGPADPVGCVSAGLYGLRCVDGCLFSTDDSPGHNN